MPHDAHLPIPVPPAAEFVDEANIKMFDHEEEFEEEEEAWSH